MRALLELSRQGIELREVAGNVHIALTLVVRRGLTLSKQDGEVTARWPVLTEPREERVLLFMPVASLSHTVKRLRARGARLDHVFDF